MSGPFVSVIVPVLNDADQLAGLLETLPACDVSRSSEVIVVDGGADPALEILWTKFPGICWSAAVAGRGSQMNHGAGLASGRWLWFVHADARIPEEWDVEIARANAIPDVVAGSFRFAVNSSSWQARLLESGVAWRVRWLNLPFGDQGLFVRREVFEALGGFRTWPLMEDVDFVRRLRRRGRLWHTDSPIRVSARRWRRDGWFVRSASNVGLLMLYLAGVSPERLARFYHRDGVPSPDQRTL